MADAIVSFAVEKLGDLLVQEADLLRGLEDQVEWIERELRLMNALLEHVEASEGQDENLEWTEDVRDVARNAEDVIDNLVHKSAQKRWRGSFMRLVLVFNDLLDRHKVGKELEGIKVRIHDVSERRRAYEIGNNIAGRGLSSPVVQTLQQHEGPSSSDITVLREDDNMTSMGNTIVSSVIEKVNAVLSLEFLFHHKVIEQAKWVRDEFMRIHDTLKNVEVVDERENVWMEELIDVSRFAEDVFGSFVGKKRQQNGWWGIFKSPILVFNDSESQLKLKRKMRQIEIKIRDVYERKWTYGIGELEGNEGLSSMVPSTNQRRQSSHPAVKEQNGFCLDGSLLCFPYQNKRRVSIVFLPVVLLNTTRKLDSWLTVEDQVESIRRHLRLMHALFEDVEGMEDLDERVKVWLQEMRDVARDVEALDIYSNKIQEEKRMMSFMRPGLIFKNLLTRAKVAKEANQIKNKIDNISERKRTYDIGSIKGRKGFSSTVQDPQERAPSISDAAEISAISNLEEALPSSTHQKERRYTVNRVIFSILEKLPDMLSQQSVKELQEQIESIRKELRLMHALFKDVEAMGELDGRVKVWVEEMRGVARDAEAVIETYVKKMDQKGRGGFKIYVSVIHDMEARHKVAKEIDQIKKKIQHISERRTAYGIEHITRREESNSMVQNLHQRRPPSYIVDEPHIIGFEEDMRVMMARLLANDKRRCVISIVGMGGIGKTTLAKLIYNNEAVVDHFPCRAWVSVPQEFSSIALLRDVAEQIMGLRELKGKWTVEEESIKMLSAFLTDKRYLIVLDGVWTTEVWDGLKEAFPDTSNGSRMVFTTRNMAVAPHADSKASLHFLKLLSEADSWALFMLTLKADIPQEVIELGKEIVKRCGGLPLAILKMGDLLSQRVATLDEWSRVLEQLNQDQRPWLETLDMINKDLPLYLRRCLFYFGLFPEGFEIPARRLIVLWVAEGLVHQRRADEEPPEYVAERYLTELIDRNMVQVTKKKLNGKVKTCRLPDALRELWLSKAKEAKFLHGHTNTSIGMIRRLADHLDKNDDCFDHIHGDNTNPSISLRPYYRDVLSFMSFDTQEGSKPGEDVGNFLHRCISSRCFQLLRVLDLERVFRPKLPKALGKLTRLRYLGLRWTYLETLPSFISNLLNLQTLDVKHTYISTLPSSIWKMQQLRHLYLSESYRSRFAPQPSGGSLMNLQTLWGVFVDEESPVKDGLDRLANLTKLGLACRQMASQQEAMLSQLDAVADWIQKLERLQYLRVRSSDELGKPWDLHLEPLSRHVNLSSISLLGRLKNPSIVSEFPLNLIDLTLSASGLLEDPMQTLDKLPNLRILRLISESFLGKNMLSSLEGFPQLRVLKLWKLQQLEEWNVEEGAMPNLRDLEIRSCESLKMLPVGLQHVRTLQELKLSNMPKDFTARYNDYPHVRIEDW